MDHFIALADGGADEFENLVYACFRCNGYKGTHGWSEDPSKSLVHPLSADFSTHIVFDERSGLLEGLTSRGRLQVELLRLNRPALVAKRLRDAMIKSLIRDQEALERTVTEDLQRIETVKKYRRVLSWMARGDAALSSEEGESG